MNKLTKNNILTYLSNNKEFLSNKFGVIRIGLFGSYASNDYNPQSDIDLVVEITKDKKNLHNFLNLKRHLEKEFNKNVDLGFETSIKPKIKENIKENIIYV